MRAVCKKKNLNIGLATASRIINGSNSLPVLNNILLRTDGGRIKISSTNLELAINTWVGGKIEEEGDITIPAKLINDYVNSISTEDLTLSSKDQTLFLEADQSKSHIKGLSSEEFPLLPQITDEVFCKTSGEELKEAIQAVVFAASFSETQPEISGVLFDFNSETLTMAATDRYRLAEAKITLEKAAVEPKKVIIPARSVIELGKIVSAGEVDIFFGEGQIMFRSADVELITRVIEGQYPDYQQIIPKGFTSEAEVDRVKFIAALRVVSLFSQENNNLEVELNPQGKKLVVRSQASQAGDSEVVVEGSVMGEKTIMTFNHRYLLECLNNLSSEKVILKTIDSNSPAAIVPKERDDYLYIVMPIKL